MTDLTILRVPVFSALCNAAFSLRREVFVWEQHVPPDEEHDVHDLTATHFVAIAEGEVVGTLRLIALPEHTKIGRVVVHNAFRGRGIAGVMMRAAMDYARDGGQPRFHLDAQVEKVGFYQNFGFAAYGDVFDDAGIPHLAMRNYEP